MEWPVSRVLSQDSHLSSTCITACLKRSVPGGQRAASALPIRSCSRRGLPGTAVTCCPVGSYPTISPLPGTGTGRSDLCCTFLWLAPTGRYPASCPAEPGLSSPACAAATIRTTPGSQYIIVRPRRHAVKYELHFFVEKSGSDCLPENVRRGKASLSTARGCQSGYIITTVSFWPEVHQCTSFTLLLLSSTKIPVFCCWEPCRRQSHGSRSFITLIRRTGSGKL